MIGIDLGKVVFQIHGVNDRERWRRTSNCAGTRRQSSSLISHFLDGVAVDTKRTRNFISANRAQICTILVRDNR
jgi:hypothetical protein